MSGEHSVKLSISAAGVESLNKFSKKRGVGGFVWSQFLDGVCWGRCDFSGGLVVHLLHENKLNS